MVGSTNCQSEISVIKKLFLVLVEGDRGTEIEAIEKAVLGV